MKTPMQELIEQLNNVKPQDFCSIETIKGWAKELLEKEKEVMCEFADDYQRNCFQKSSDDYYNETFNNKRNERRSIQQNDGAPIGGRRTTGGKSKRNQPQKTD